MEATSWL